ncbi:MAG: hypothetical protein E7212_06990 [Clostridium sartagoforme]|nr:hypothetical protein [Clostridium sartagoforme]
MLYSSVLSSRDITELVNIKGKSKGIKVTHIEIDNGIKFSGEISSKFNSKFSGSLYIKNFCGNKIIVGTKDIKIDKLGLLKGTSSILFKSLFKIIGEGYISIKEKDIIINLDKYKDEIKDIYIKDKLLYIIGLNLKMYLNA